MLAGGAALTMMLCCAGLLRRSSSSASRSCRSSGLVNICKPAVRLLRPFLLRPVPIKLDAVVVRVAQIERLGDAVVAGAFERDLGDDQPAQRVGQQPPGRVEDRGMVKAGGAGGGGEPPRLSQVLSPIWWW